MRNGGSVQACRNTDHELLVYTEDKDHWQFVYFHLHCNSPPHSLSTFTSKKKRNDNQQLKQLGQEALTENSQMTSNPLFLCSGPEKKQDIKNVSPEKIFSNIN